MQVLMKKTYPRSVLLFLIYGALFFSAQKSTREYQLKAAFLFNFTQFVEWPAHTFPSSQAPAVIGILGKDPFGNYLEEIIKGETIDKHALVIQHFETVEEVTNCQILFINVSDKTQLQSIIKKLKGKSMLTISEASGFSKLGGMIRLYTKDDKINIQINVDATKEENLTISSKLLKLAEIVKGD